MITTQQIAEYIENGLNAALQYEGLSFKIWATAGERDKPVRSGNTVNYSIDGNFRVVTSSLTPNILVMGVNAFTLTFDVPVNPPKTSALQTAEDLARVRDGQYWFVLYIERIISSYFKLPQELSFTDDEGTYNATLAAGVAIPEGVDLTAWRGNTVPVDVYIELTIGQNAVMSRSAVIEIDGEPVPFVSFIPERASVVDAAQYSSDESTKTLATASAIVAEVNIPLNTKYGSSDAVLDYFFGGHNNVVHFLKIALGQKSDVYLVEISRATVGLENAKIASSTFRLSEAVADADLLDVPEGFQVGYFTMQSSAVTSITITVSEPCLLCVAGQAYEVSDQITVPLIPKYIPYNDDAGTYRLYVITNTAVTVSASGYTFEVENG